MTVSLTTVMLPNDGSSVYCGLSAEDVRSSVVVAKYPLMVRVCLCVGGSIALHKSSAAHPTNTSVFPFFTCTNTQQQQEVHSVAFAESLGECVEEKEPSSPRSMIRAKLSGKESCVCFPLSGWLW